MEKLKSALKHFKELTEDGVAFLITEKELENEEEVQARISICESNAGKCYNAKSGKCKVCHCPIRKKARALRNRNPKKFRVEVTHCPKGLWNDIDIANKYRKEDGKFLLTPKSN